MNSLTSHSDIGDPAHRMVSHTSPRNGQVDTTGIGASLGGADGGKDESTVDCEVISTINAS